MPGQDRAGYVPRRYGFMPRYAPPPAPGTYVQPLSSHTPPPARGMHRPHLRRSDPGLQLIARLEGGPAGHTMPFQGQ